MRKFCITFLIIAIIVLGATAGLNLTGDVSHTEYLRIHIRADSNLAEAQQVKYKVKDAVVEYLTPKLTECTTKQKAERVISESLSDIQAIADRVLKDNGLNYISNAKLNTEKFPTRTYKNLTLDGGYYDALIVELGSGKGDNWWCVVYPPLCFTDGESGYVYKSKIKQIINDFYEKRLKEEK